MWYERLQSKDKKFHFHMELTTKCNAACPICPRFVSSTPLRSNNVPLWEMTIEQVKKWFPIELVKKIGSMNICGNFGDPCSCKDVYEIVEYFHVNNPEAKIELRTNGGAQSVAFWEKIGKLSADSVDRIRVVFSVDGLEDTNDLYRRNVKWHILDRNITTFTSNGGYGIQEFLVFNHNEHQIEEVKEQYKKWNLRYISFKKAFGFEDPFNKGKQRPFPVYDKKGHLEYFLKPSMEYNNSELPLDEDVSHVPTHINLHPDFLKELEAKHRDYVPTDYTLFDHLNNSKISCQAETDHNGNLEVYFNSNGDVRPCCHTGIESDRTIGSHESLQLRNDMLYPKESFNLETNSFEDILKLFDERFVNKWTATHDTGKCLKCSIQCGQVHQSNSERLYGADKLIKDKLGYVADENTGYFKESDEE